MWSTNPSSHKPNTLFCLEWRQRHLIPHRLPRMPPSSAVCSRIMKPSASAAPHIHSLNSRPVSLGSPLCGAFRRFRLTQLQWLGLATRIQKPTVVQTRCWLQMLSLAGLDPKRSRLLQQLGDYRLEGKVIIKRKSKNISVHFCFGCFSLLINFINQKFLHGSTWDTNMFNGV